MHYFHPINKAFEERSWLLINIIVKALRSTLWVIGCSNSPGKIISVLVIVLYIEDFKVIKLSTSIIIL